MFFGMVADIWWKPPYVGLDTGLLFFFFFFSFDHLEIFYGRRPEEFSLFTFSKPRLQEVMGVVYKYWVNSGKIIDAKGQC